MARMRWIGRYKNKIEKREKRMRSSVACNREQQINSKYLHVYGSIKSMYVKIQNNMYMAKRNLARAKGCEPNFESNKHVFWVINCYSSLFILHK